ALDKRYQDKKISYETRKDRYDQSLQEIPEELRSLQQLNERLQKEKQVKERLDAQWKAAQEELTKAKEEVATAEANTSNAKKQHQEANEKTRKAARQFENKLEKSGFSSESKYQNAKIADDSQKKLQKAIDAYQTE